MQLKMMFAEHHNSICMYLYENICMYLDKHFCSYSSSRRSEHLQNVFYH